MDLYFWRKNSLGIINIWVSNIAKMITRLDLDICEICILECYSTFLLTLFFKVQKKIQLQLVQVKLSFNNTNLFMYTIRILIWLLKKCVWYEVTFELFRFYFKQHSNIFLNKSNLVLQSCSIPSVPLKVAKSEKHYLSILIR